MTLKICLVWSSISLKFCNNQEEKVSFTIHGKEYFEAGIPFQTSLIRETPLTKLEAPKFSAYITMLFSIDDSGKKTKFEKPIKITKLSKEDLDIDLPEYLFDTRQKSPSVDEDTSYTLTRLFAEINTAIIDPEISKPTKTKVLAEGLIILQAYFKKRFEADQENPLLETAANTAKAALERLPKTLNLFSYQAIRTKSAPNLFRTHTPDDEEATKRPRTVFSDTRPTYACRKLIFKPKAVKMKPVQDLSFKESSE